MLIFSSSLINLLFDLNEQWIICNCAQVPSSDNWSRVCRQVCRQNTLQPRLHKRNPAWNCAHVSLHNQPANHPSDWRLWHTHSHDSRYGIVSQVKFTFLLNTWDTECIIKIRKLFLNVRWEVHVGLYTYELSWHVVIQSRSKTIILLVFLAFSVIWYTKLGANLRHLTLVIYYNYTLK